MDSVTRLPLLKYGGEEKTPLPLHSGKQPHSQTGPPPALPFPIKSSQELLPKYTEQERHLIFPDGMRVQAVFQQPELRGVSAPARPRVTLRMVLVLFAELLFLCFGSQRFLRRPF